MNKYDLDPVAKLLDYIEPKNLEQIIDDVQFEYSRYVMLDSDNCGKNESAAEKLHYLRELRNAMREVCQDLINDEST